MSTALVVVGSKRKAGAGDVSGTAGGSILCPTCGEKFSTNSTMRKHILRRHNEERNFACSKRCGYAAKSKADCTQHETYCVKGSDYGKALICRTCNMELSSHDTCKSHRKHTKHSTFDIDWPVGPAAYGQVLTHLAIGQPLPPVPKASLAQVVRVQRLPEEEGEAPQQTGQLEAQEEAGAPRRRDEND